MPLDYGAAIGQEPENCVFNGSYQAMPLGATFFVLLTQ